MYERWLIRASQWSRKPPPLRKVVAVLVVIALCLGLLGIEHFWGWPAWLTVNGRPKLR